MNFSSTIEQSSTNSSRPWIMPVVSDQPIHLGFILIVMRALFHEFDKVVERPHGFVDSLDLEDAVAIDAKLGEFA